MYLNMTKEFGVTSDTTPKRVQIFSFIGAAKLLLQLDERREKRKQKPSTPVKEPSGPLCLKRSSTFNSGHFRTRWFWHSPCFGRVLWRRWGYHSAQSTQKRCMQFWQKQKWSWPNGGIYEGSVVKSEETKSTGSSSSTFSVFTDGLSTPIQT